MSRLLSPSLFRSSLPWISALLGGFLLGLALPPYQANGLAWVAFVPLILSAFITPPKNPGGVGFVMGLSFFGSTLWWIGHVTIIGAFFLCSYLSIYFSLWFRLHQFWSTRFLSPSTSDAKAISLTSFKIAALSASSWTLLEWTRGWFLTGFGWNGLAITQSHVIPIIQWASVGGTLLISWWIVFVNVILAYGIRRFHEDIRTGRGYRRYLDLYLVLVAFMGIHLWGFFRIQSLPSQTIHSLRYVSIQPNIPQSEKFSPMSGTQILLKHMNLTLNAIEGVSPDLVLWPETSSGKIFSTDFELKESVERIQKAGNFDFIMGAIDLENEKTFNAAFWFPPSEGIQPKEIYHKNHLVVFGEYTPFWDTFPYLGSLYPITRGYSWGKGMKVFTLARNPVRVAPIICFEDTLSSLVREANQQKPEILINLTNDAWFKDSPAAEQHLANAVFRTVEFDLPMIRSTNSGVTCHITQNGIVERVLKNENGKKIEIEGALISDLRWTPSQTTLYERWGNWIVLVSLLILLMSYMKHRSTTQTLKP